MLKLFWIIIIPWCSTAPKRRIQPITSHRDILVSQLRNFQSKWDSLNEELAQVIIIAKHLTLLILT